MSAITMTAKPREIGCCLRAFIVFLLSAFGLFLFSLIFR
jgi:hypothetical protein